MLNGRTSHNKVPLKCFEGPFHSSSNRGILGVLGQEKGILSAAIHVLIGLEYVGVDAIFRSFSQAIALV